MVNLMLAIATLCTVPTNSSLWSQKSVLDCQKYYIKCITDKNTLNERKLPECVLSKEQLGGLK